jgi:A/G-specific adenine glycosylase
MNPLTNKILTWFDQNRRPMPWREQPLPYYVWISEIMAQQTRIDTVIGYFDRFIRSFPTIDALAAASEEEVLKLWQGLGYYSRARNIHKVARILVQEYNGNLPSSYDELLALPGIGPYTAGAIASIAFGQQALAIDGNVNRVIARLHGIDEDLSSRSAQRQIEQYVLELLSQERPGDFNQALMEIGALVCIPNGAPKCAECPLQDSCVAFQNHLTDVIPRKKKKTCGESRTANDYRDALW